MWKTPKTDWTIDDRFNIEDYNRIKNNLNYLHDKSEEIFGEYDIADMGEDVLSHAGFWDVATFNEFETNLETINAHMINAEIGLKQTFYPNGVFIGFAELNRIEGATLTLKAVIDGWYEGMKVLSFRLGGSQIGSDRIQRKDSVVSIAVTGTESIHAYVDEPLDLTGVVVTATYKSGETQNVTSECVFDPANGTIMTQTGQQTISVSYTEDGKTVTTSFVINVSMHVPTWADGTDTQIAQALQLHYNGDIDLTEYWHVGDTRRVHLSAMTPYSYTSSGVTYSGASHEAQDVDLVLMHQGGRYTNYSGGQPSNECLFVVGMKSCLLEKDAISYKPVSASSGRNFGDLPQWGEYRFKDAIPETLRSIFKAFYNPSVVYSINGGGTRGGAERGYFFPFSEYELTGQNEEGYDETTNTSETNIIQFDYYKTQTNRRKRIGIDGGWQNYWLANRRTNMAEAYVCYVSSSQYVAYSTYSNQLGVSVYGVI